MSTPDQTQHWADVIATLEREASASVLVTVLGARGSTPRTSGTKMVFSSDRSYGTIGGGHLEFEAARIAATLLADNKAQQYVEYFPLGPSLGQCCGGSTTLLFECFPANEFNVMLFGAGHVGRALVTILQQLPCQVHWVDAREQQHPHIEHSNIRAIVNDTPADEIARMPAGSDYLIMTHSHQQDFDILESILKREDARYIGLIGSVTKWRRFTMRLEHKGFDPKMYSKVHCPVGLSAVPGKRPMEVAVSIAAQLIAVNHEAASVVTTAVTATTKAAASGINARQAQQLKTSINMEPEQL